MTRPARIGARLALGAAIFATAAGCGSGSGAPPRTVPQPPRIARLGLPVRFASDRPVDTGRAQSEHDQGTVLASDGFVPNRDGFSFENYGYIAGPQIDAHDLRQMFGDGVCLGPPSDLCTLTPAAQQFAAQLAAGMNGGHCFGFAVTAWRFFEHRLSQGDFGGTTTFSLPFTPPLDSAIAYGWAMQLLPAVQRAVIADTPTHEIAFLRRALADPGRELYTLGIRAPAGGHAVTPIAIESLGSGQYEIVIYDNNFPGIYRAISIDSTTDTWSYNGAPNPAYPPERYSGQGSSNPIELIPLSPGLGVQPCPFCRPAATGAGSRPANPLLISLAGNPVAHGHLLITAAGGRRLGYVRGRLVDEIPGARAITPLGSDDFLAHPEPFYELPARIGPLQVTLDGAGATGHDLAEIHVTGAGFGATLSGLRPAPGSLTRLALGRMPGSVAFSGPGAGARLTLGLDRAAGGSELTIAGAPSLALTPLPTGRAVRLSSTLAGPVSAQLTVTAVSAGGTRPARRANVRLAPHRSVAIQLG